jgi:amino acid adenylation domain-containing protein
MQAIMSTTLNTVIHILAVAKQQGISITLKEDQLAIAVEKGRTIDPAIIDEIRSKKAEIMRFLESEAGNSSIVNAREEKIIPVSRHNDEKPPLSYAQHRLWIIDQLKGSVEYHLPLAIRLTGPLDKAAIAFAVGGIMRRHEALRTVVKEADGVIFQHVLPVDSWRLDAEDLLPGSDTPEQYISRYIARPFDLSQDHMLRAVLLREDSETHILAVVVHHIASDGWSMQIMVREFIELYRSFKTGQPAALSVQEISYADYAGWQRRFLNEGRMQQQLAFWENKLRDVQPLELPTDYARPAIQGVNGKVLHFLIDPGLTGKLQLLSQQEGVTMFMTLLAAFNVLLYRYTGQRDICIGTPVANRTQRATENLIGFFVNTLALHNHISDIPFRSLLQQVKQCTLDAYAHQDIPFEKVVERLAGARDLSRSPLFQVMFVLQNTPRMPVVDLDDVSLDVLPVETGTAKFDLCLETVWTEDGLHLRVEYCSDLFREDTVTRMMRHYRNLLAALATAPDKCIEAVAMADDEETRRLLSFGDTAWEYPAHKTIVELFEDSANRTPEAVAVVFEGQAISYRQLQERSSQLASYLTGRGVSREALIPLYTDRSPEMIISILGILKSGGAYVPVDLSYPMQRIAYILKDTSARIVLGRGFPEDLLEQASDAGIQIIDLDKEAAVIGAYRPASVVSGPEPSSAAYVIYTSGSTGQPKGVVVEHRSVVNLISYQTRLFNIGPGERILQFSGYSFDASVEQIFLALLNGAALVLITEEDRLNRHGLEQLLHREQITHLHATPGYLDHITPGAYGGLKRVIAGGDTCKKELAERWRGFADFYNEYGPTETTITATVQLYDDSCAVHTRSVPIGRPVGNTHVYLLDENMRLLPVGVEGELYIGGAGVARGYLNKPELSATRFLPDPFREGGRMYRTGDRGKWLPDGTIAFLGRYDDQVKIRGYRIELNEITAKLLDHEDINAAAAVTRVAADGEREVIAYVTGKRALKPADIRLHLSKHLPVYMLPAHYVQLETLPLTPNGKIDLRHLPQPETSGLPVSDAYVAPRNGIEKAIVVIWQEVLGKEKVGVYDNFFEAGGNSMKLIKMVSLINERLGKTITAVTVFRLPNIRAISEHIAANGYAGESESMDEIRNGLSIMESTIDLLTLSSSGDEE